MFRCCARDHVLVTCPPGADDVMIGVHGSACRGCCRLALGPQLGWWGQTQSRVPGPAGEGASHSSAETTTTATATASLNNVYSASAELRLLLTAQLRTETHLPEPERNTHVHQRKEAIELVVLLQNVSNCFVGKLDKSR